MHAPATPSAAEPAAAFAGAPGSEFAALVCSGAGEAAGFVGIDWVRHGMQQALGFDPWPGTLNLRLHQADWPRWRAALAQRAGIRLAPAPGFCAASCFPVRLNGCVDAAAVFPAVDGYPEDKLELVAAQHLRSLLGLRDGDRVRIALQD